MSKYVRTEDSSDPWLIDESNQTWTLAKKASISVVDEPGILVDAGFDNNTLRVKGDIVASGSGFGIQLTGEHSILKIAKSSNIEGNAGVLANSANGTIRNAGDISGEPYGVMLDAPTELVNRGEITGDIAVSTTGGSDIQNLKGGLIEGVSRGIYVADQSSTSIENAGIIRSGDMAVLFTSSAGSEDSILINTGKIVGDVLLGTGDDRIDSRAGRINGTVNGRDGDDVYIIGKHSGELVEDFDNGRDHVDALFSHRLAENFESLTLIGTRSSKATGNDSANVLTGNAGDNNVIGLAGADFVGGGRGDDMLKGGADNDDFVFNKGDDRDTIKDFDVTGDDIALLEFGFDEFGDIASLISQHGDDTWISLGGGDRIILRNVDADALTNDMFIFSYSEVAFA